MRKIKRLVRNLISYISIKFCNKKYDLDYFKGKRVAIIGPADSAYKEKMGSEIDKYDIVVRINKALPLNPNNSEYIGTKTDVLFHGLNPDPIVGCGTVDTFLWRKNGVKRVYFPRSGVEFSSEKAVFNRRNTLLIPIYHMDNDFYQNLKQEIQDYMPTTGFACIYSILKAQPTEVFITGFTFFQTPYALGYRDHLIEVEKNLEHLKNLGIHNGDVEFTAFKNLISRKKFIRLKLDKFLIDATNCDL